MNLPRPSPFRAGLLVAALAILVYLNMLPNAFVLDDRTLILENRFLRQRDGLQKIFTTGVLAFFGREGASNYYRPLMHTTWYVWWRIFHQKPAGYHALSIFIHATVSVLVFLWLRRIQPNELVAWLAALLFAVHPIHSEAVDWVSAMPDLQCTLFFLQGFLFYLRAEEVGGWRRYGMEAGAAACVLLGLMAKEIGFVLPLMLGLYELLQRQRGPLTLFRHRPFAWWGMAAALTLYLGMRWYALGGLMPLGSRFQVTPGEMIAGWLALLAEYTARLVYPATLSFAHLVPIPSGILDGKLVAGLAVTAGSTALGVGLYRRGQPEWLAPVLFFAALLPSFPASLQENSFWLGERYIYLSSIGFCWLLAAAMERIGSRTGWRPVAALTLALVGVCSARTVLRNQDWRDEICFYLHELRTEQESMQLRLLLAETYVRRDMPREAFDHARAFVRLAPFEARARNLLGFVYSSLGEREKALSEYGLALKYAMERGETVPAARAMNNLALAHSEMGRLDLALLEFREAVRLDPESALGHNHLGLALYLSGRLEEAVLHLRAAIRLNPEFVYAHGNLGLALAAQRQLPEARDALAEALRLEPENAETLARVGVVELLAGNRQAARRSFVGALSRDPANARALAGMAKLRAAEGHP